MAKTELKIIIAVVLLILLAYFIWPDLHLFLMGLIGSEWALMSIPIMIISYIVIIKVIFKEIDSKNSSNDSDSNYNNYNNYTNQNPRKTIGEYRERSNMGQSYYGDRDISDYSNNNDEKF